MIQDTTLRSWYELQSSLGETQRIVLDEIKKEPATIRELAARLNWQNGTVSGRVNDLQKKNLIRAAAKTHCKITGKLSYLWESTAPKFPPARKPVESAQQELI